MTVRFRADANVNENSWKLFQGRGTTGTILQHVDVFPYKTNYYYVDFCLPSGLYTLQGFDSWGDGWQVNTGYTLTADIGEFELDVMELSSGTAPVSTTSTFSTFFPFQVNSGEWKIYQGDFVNGWNGLNFDDSSWVSKKSSEIPTTEQITTYIRKSFSLTNVVDYQVLNVRLKYSGGVACYFNGNLVARINLADDFEPSTESMSVHDASVFSKFHIILPTSGVVEGLNVIAFERFAQWALTACRCFVATASIAGVRGLEDTNGYSASKAYMINAMEGYRRKARHGGFACRYVTLLPGFVDTAMGQASRFWRCSAETAANVIVRGLQRGGEVLYVTPRWRWIALLMRCLPRGIFERIPLK